MISVNFEHTSRRDFDSRLLKCVICSAKTGESSVRDKGSVRVFPVKSSWIMPLDEGIIFYI